MEYVIKLRIAFAIIMSIFIIAMLVITFILIFGNSENFAVPITAGTCTSCNNECFAPRNLEFSKITPINEKRVDVVRDDIIEHWEFNNSLVPLNKHYLINSLYS